MTDKKAVLVIHGGAGSILKKNMPQEKEEAYRKKLEEALHAGHHVLQEGGTSREAVTAAITVMEDSPLFNAGRGAVFTHNETNELDASIMDGETLEAGAVAGVSHIKNPILLADAVLNNSNHVLLIGEGAEGFAKTQNIEIVDPSYFFNEVRFQQLKKLQKTEDFILDHDSDRGETLPDSSEIEFNINILPEDQKFGTVGAVALDHNGNLAAGTSTGGMTNKRFGRVGDSPLIGAGTYASNATCAISCTGHGEFFIRYATAYDVHARMAYQNTSLQMAADSTINHVLKPAGGGGGVIGLTAQGDYCMTFNTPGMYRAVMFDDGTFWIGIYATDEK